MFVLRFVNCNNIIKMVRINYYIIERPADVECRCEYVIKNTNQRRGNDCK